MKLKKPASIKVESLSIEPGKTYELREVAPPPLPSPPKVETPIDPVVGQYMSFHRLSSDELQDYYKLLEEPDSSRKSYIKGRIYNTSLGLHPDSPLDLHDGAVVEYYKKNIKK